MPRLKITEIFYSLQGEADTAGIPTTFVRLTGCPLRCQYCDTAYAFHGGEWWEIDAILARGELADYHLAHSARGELCRRVGRTKDARVSFQRALELSRQEPERRFLKRRLAELSGQTG